jgi:head-tail adaptor
MAFRRNCGRFNKKIILMCPLALQRDELGGLTAGGYTDVGAVMAMVESRTQSRQTVMGDYVTTDTRYFVMRDVTSLYQGISTQWRIRYNGYVYQINQVEVIDEGKPFYLQLTATAINAGGSAI